MDNLQSNDAWVLNKTIAVDFDGTLCTNRYPAMGKPRRWLIRKCKRWQKQGKTVILWTCRTGALLQDALLACDAWGFQPDFVNCNPPERVAFFQNDPRKIGADLYIDDKQGGLWWLITRLRA